MTHFNEGGAIMFNVNTISYIHIYCYNLDTYILL